MCWMLLRGVEAEQVTETKLRVAHRNALDPIEAVMIRGKGYGSFQPLGYLIITASVKWGAFLVIPLKPP